MKFFNNISLSVNACNPKKIFYKNEKLFFDLSIDDQFFDENSIKKAQESQWIIQMLIKI